MFMENELPMKIYRKYLGSGKDAAEVVGMSRNDDKAAVESVMNDVAYAFRKALKEYK